MLSRTNQLILKHLQRFEQFTFSNVHLKRFQHRKLKYYREMPPATEAFVRLIDNDKFSLLFTFYDEKSNQTKTFKMQRDLQEPIQKLFQRMLIKINGGYKKKKKNKSLSEDENTSPPIVINFIINDQPVSMDTSCSKLFNTYKDEKLMMKIGDNEYRVSINHPWIQSVMLPKIILAGYPVFPYKMELFYATEENCEYLWYKQRTEDSSEVAELLHSGYLYFPTIQDIGFHLRLVCTPKEGNKIGESVTTISNGVVEAGPGQSFSSIRHSFTREHLSGNSFRVVSYNILAELYSSSVAGKTELFTYCLPYALNGSYRKLLLLNEILGYNADIICLQEVDCSLFKRDLTSVLNTDNFEGVLAKKGGDVNEGVACFYRKSRFRLIENYTSLLGKQSEEKLYDKNIWEKISSNETLAATLKNLTTTVQVLLFDYVEKAKHKLIVANTHLYFHPNADVIRILQAAICLNLVNHVKETVQKHEPDCTVSVIFCGDFNSTPECGVFHLFTKNHLPEDYHEWKSASSELEIKGLSFHNNTNFGSACGTPEFTNFTVGFEGCLDYIFYNTDFLDVEQVLPFPSRKEVSEYIAIPSVVFPSDHISLVADLKWKK